jgi:hypothetical protein
MEQRVVGRREFMAPFSQEEEDATYPRIGSFIIA